MDDLAKGADESAIHIVSSGWGRGESFDFGVHILYVLLFEDSCFRAGGLLLFSISTGKHHAKEWTHRF